MFSTDLWRPFEIRPVTYLTFWLNAQAGRDPFGYHAMNLALHLAAAILLFLALRALVPEKAAWIAAAIFAVHPFQAEAVNYIFARSIELATIFCLLSLWCWTRGRVWWAAVWFGVALLAKEECAAFPVFLLALHAAGKRERRELAPMGTMVLLALAAGLRVMLVGAGIAGSGIGSQSGVTARTYALTEGTVILRYLRMLVVPVGFSVDPEIHVPSLLLGVLAWAFVLVLAAIALLRFRGAGPGFWFVSGLVLLLPSSSILPAADLAADRRMYLPMIAFATCAGLLLQDVKPVWPAALLLALAGISFERTTVWRTEESLWADAAAKAPGKIRPKIQLARAAAPGRAIEILEGAKRSAPADERIPAEEGRVYLSAGKPLQALDQFGRALALAPQSADAFNNRGAALLALGQREAARQDFEHALAIAPCAFDARLNLLRVGIAGPQPAGCSFSADQRRALGWN